MNKEERKTLIKVLEYANDLEEAYLDVVKNAMGESHHIHALNFLQDYDSCSFVPDFAGLHDKVAECKENMRVWREKQEKEKKDEK